MLSPRALKVDEERNAGHIDVIQEGLPLLALKMGTRPQRNAGSLQKLGKAKKQILF